MVKEEIVYLRDYTNITTPNFTYEQNDLADYIIENGMLKVTPFRAWAGVGYFYPIINGEQVPLETNVAYTVEFSIDLGNTRPEDVLNVSLTSNAQYQNLASYGAGGVTLIDIIPDTPQITSSGVYRISYKGTGQRFIKFYYRRTTIPPPGLGSSNYFYIKYIKVLKLTNTQDVATLNTSNKNIILQNISCCIGKKTQELVKLKTQGDLVQYKKCLKKLYILEHVYSIILNYDFTTSTNNCLKLDKLNHLYIQAMKYCDFCNC